MTTTESEGEFTIRSATPEEAATLSDIAVRAKAHWGYSKEQLDSWTKEFLTVSSDYIRNNHVWVAVNGAEILGVSGVRIHDDMAELDHLWVAPAYIGRGVGKRLFLYAAKMTNELGCSELVFTSDPNADGFYQKLGAEKIGDDESVFQKRSLTKFKFKLK